MNPRSRAILSANDEALRALMLKEAKAGASVRDLERMSKGTAPKAAPQRKQKNNYYSEVELSLKTELGRKVNIKPTGKGKGTITIEFYSDDELADFARRLSE